jgi:hypothetical protein
MEHQHLEGSATETNVEDELTKAQNSLLAIFCTLKKVAVLLLMIFPSTYTCESLFSITYI